MVSTAQTYTTVQADVGQTLTVSASYTDDQGSAETPVSSATSAVSNTNDLGSITIDDTTPNQGQLLTATVTDIDGVSGVITYQWLRGATVV
ncbi:hypothetical protein H4J38_16970, partial [Colwellia sp. BRX10-3]|uniref:hypothetical protein n=1 Tax=Colwellia sp. BRX10-3 TaxID=2759844 RepID=UPI0015F657AE